MVATDAGRTAIFRAPIASGVCPVANTQDSESMRIGIHPALKHRDGGIYQYIRPIYVLCTEAGAFAFVFPPLHIALASCLVESYRVFTVQAHSSP